MATNEPNSVEEIEQELAKLTNERQELRARALALTERRDQLLAQSRAASLVGSLSDAERSAVAAALSESSD